VEFVPHAEGRSWRLAPRGPNGRPAVVAMRKALLLSAGGAIVVAAALLLGWGLGWFPAGSAHPPPSIPPSTPPPAAIQHVVVVVLENQPLSAVYAQAPYERFLQHTYGNVTPFYGACHNSLPEYAAMTSGRSYSCTTIPIQAVTNLADLLEMKGDSWYGYFESMPTPCATTSSGAYVTNHNPFLLYQDIRENASRCDAHVLNSAAFNASLRAGALPTFSYYVPNIYDDGFKSSTAATDLWLNNFLSPILNSTNPTVTAELATTAFFIVSDEGTDSDLSGYSSGGVVSGWCQNQTQQPLSVCGGETYLAVVSPQSHGTVYTLSATDYNLQSTVEWLLGLGSDGGNDGTPGFPAMTSLFVGEYLN
jgi:phosphoesterase family protein